MLLRLMPDKWTIDPRPIRTVGLLMLVAAIAWSRFAPASLTEDARDTTHGFLLGVSIALMLWSIVIQIRARR